MTATKLSATKQAKALAIVARWMGPYVCDKGPAPTGREAAERGLGPMLVADWDWPSNGPTPAILLEGGPDDWAIRVAGDIKACAAFAKIGVFAEPYAGWALCLYPE